MYKEKKSTAIVGPAGTGKTQHLLSYIEELVNNGDDVIILSSKRGDKYSRFNGKAVIYTTDFENKFDAIMSARKNKNDKIMYIFLDDFFEICSKGFHQEKLIAALENKSNTKTEFIIVSQEKSYIKGVYASLWDTIMDL